MIYILCELGPPWNVLATALSVVPPVAREAGYAVVARSRYRIFGRREACSLPEERWRARFIDRWLRTSYCSARTSWKGASARR